MTTWNDADTDETDGNTDRSPTESSDTTGSIRIAVEASGRLSELRISARWRERFQPNELADVLTSTLNRAVSDARAGERPKTTPGISTEEWQAAFAELSFEQTLEAASRVTELFDRCMTEADTRLERIDEVLAGYEGRDERRRVRVEVTTTGFVTDLSIDDRWGASTPLDTLHETIRTAFDNAYAQVDAMLADFPAETPPTAEATRVLSDPLLFRAWLREEVA